MKWTETITPKQAVEELGVPYHGWMREMDRAWVSEDGQYSVMSRLLRTPAPHACRQGRARCYHVGRRVRQVRWQRGHSVGGQDADQKRIVRRKARRHRGIPVAGQAGGCRRYLSPVGV